MIRVSTKGRKGEERRKAEEGWRVGELTMVVKSKRLCGVGVCVACAGRMDRVRELCVYKLKTVAVSSLQLQFQSFLFFSLLCLFQSTDWNTTSLFYSMFPNLASNFVSEVLRRPSFASQTESFSLVVCVPCIKSVIYFLLKYQYHHLQTEN
jgi:hypothetical protein